MQQGNYGQRTSRGRFVVSSAIALFSTPIPATMAGIRLLEAPRSALDRREALFRSRRHPVARFALADRVYNSCMQPVDMVKLWEEHTAQEFATRDTEATLATMNDDAYVNHVPVMTGGCGKAALRQFYSTDFIPHMPPDTKLELVSRTIGENQLVDEMIFSFTHTREIPWMLPGLAPTSRRVEVPLVAVVGFRDGKLAHERIYWDQGSVLKQLGLLADESLPVTGAECARKVLHPHMP